MPATNPSELTVTLRNGEVALIRPITGEDGDRLVRFHATLSDRSIYQRYFSAHPRLSEAEVHRFTNVDHSQREAYIGLVDNEIVGVGRWDVIDAERAEVAFLITDSYQRLGLGSVLFALLAQAASSRGISQFVAEVLPQNRGMIKLFEDLGECFERVNEEGTAFLTVDLPNVTPGGLEVES